VVDSESQHSDIEVALGCTVAVVEARSPEPHIEVVLLVAADIVVAIVAVDIV
jgi:hypothetical protein